MIKIQRLLTILASILLSTACYADDINGLPMQYPSLSFSDKLPPNSRQIWDIETDNKGITYFATCEGLVTNTFRLWENNLTNTNEGTIFSLAIINDTIWVGKTNEVGYYIRNNKGQLIYHKTDVLFEGTIWNIIPSGGEVILQTEYRLYRLNTNTYEEKEIIAPARINGIYEHSDYIYYTLRNGNIGILTGNKLHSIKLAKQLIEKEVRSTIVQNNIHYYFLLDGTILAYNPKTSTISTINDSKSNKKIFTTCKIDDDRWAMGSITDGLAFCNINEDMEASHQINNKNGLDDNTVLSISQNKDKQLWIGQDYGLNFIETNSPFRKIFSGATVYDLVKFNDVWYIATNKGLYYAESGKNFKLYPNSEGQVWSLTHSPNGLIVSHINRSFIINSNKEQEYLCPLEDVNHIYPLDDTNNHLLAFSYAKTFLCTKDKNLEWSKREILNLGFTNIVEAKKKASNLNYLYLKNTTGKNMYLEISPKGNIRSKIEFTADQVFSLGDDIVIIKDSIAYNPIIKGEILTLTINNNYPFENKVGNNTVNIYSANDNQDIILNTKDEILYYNQLKDGTYLEYSNLFGTFSQTLNTKGEHLKIIDSHVFLFSGQSIYSYNLDFRSKHTNKKVLVNRITTYEKDSISKYHYPATLQMIETKFYPNIIFEYGIEALKFDDIKFCYKLSSSNNDFSPWTSERKLQFTNLPNGAHTLYIKAKVNNVEYSDFEFSFTVNGQWYQKIWGQMLLGILIILLTIGFIILRYKIAVKGRLEEVKKQHTKDLLKTRNQQGIEFLTRIEQKNLFMEKIKTSLASMRNEKSRELVRLIEAESKKESKDFVYFNFFADNQQDFISALSRKYPILTTNDLRLILFIKLNMSTKDIAAITHTSAPSVEKARYRLRKKMNLNNEVSLSKYLLTFEKENIKN